MPKLDKFHYLNFILTILALVLALQIVSMKNFNTSAYAQETSSFQDTDMILYEILNRIDGLDELDRITFDVRIVEATPSAGPLRVDLYTNSLSGCAEPVKVKICK